MSDDAQTDTNLQPPIFERFWEKPKWEKLTAKFIDSIPIASQWHDSTVKLGFTAKICRRIVAFSSYWPSPSASHDSMLVRMKEYAAATGEHPLEGKAKELVFLAICAVLAHRDVPEYRAEEVDELIRILYPSLVPKTCRARFSGIKWIGRLCTLIFPIWGRSCHNIFLLFGLEPRGYSLLRASQVHSLPMTTQHLGDSQWKDVMTGEDWAYFCLPCVVFALLAPFVSVSFETVCDILEYRGAVAEDAKAYQSVLGDITAAETAPLHATNSWVKLILAEPPAIGREWLRTVEPFHNIELARRLLMFDQEKERTK